MANIIITHGYAHRLRADGLTESATFDENTNEFGSWDIRGIADMDLSGGDWVLISDTLKRFRQVFQSKGRRTPVKTPDQPQGQSVEAQQIQ